MSVDLVVRSVPTLSAEEGNGLFIQNAMLGIERPELVWTKVKALPDPTMLTPVLLSLTARQRAVSALEYIVQQGGVRERSVLREGRRVKGRIWDRGLNANFNLKHSDAGQKLFVNFLRVLPQFGVSSTADKEAEKRLRAAMRDLVPPSKCSGDHIVYVLLLLQLESFRLPSKEMEEIAKQLRRQAPLAMLFELGRDPPDTDFSAATNVITHAKNIRIFECIDDALVPHWTASLQVTWKRMLMAEAVIARWNSAARMLNALIDSLDRERRLDLTRCLMRFTNALINEALAGKPADVRKNAGSLPGVYSVKDRESVCNAIVAVLNVGQRLFKLNGIMGAERYGDDRYEEAQLFLRAAATDLIPLRGRLDDLTREMSGIIG